MAKQLAKREVRAFFSDQGVIRAINDGSLLLPLAQDIIARTSGEQIPQRQVTNHLGLWVL